MNEPTYINAPDALVYAAYDGNYDLVKALIDTGVNISVTNEGGSTALIVAADEGYLGVVELLLESGANSNLIDNDGDTALAIARFKEHEEIGKILLRFGAIGRNGSSAKQRMWDEIYDGTEEATRFKNGTYY